MNKLKRTAVCAALLLLTQGALACEFPEPVKNLPDGGTATRDDMVKGKKLVQSYIAEMESYLSCIEAREAEAQLAMGEVDEDTRRRRSAMFDKKYNAAVTEMNLIAEEFNIQLRLWNEERKKK